MWAPVTLALSLAVFPAAASASAAAVDSSEISYLYVDANEDRASGGHAAIRMGDEVFHFQYDRGLMRLDRDEWRDFELDYRGFQNRTLRVSRVAVSDDTEARLHAAFRQRHLSRTLQIELLDAAVADEALVAKLIDSERPAVALPGLGFFASRAEDVATRASRRLASLRAAIEADPRSAPLDATSRALDAALRGLPVRPLDLSSVDFEPDSFPRPRYAFHQRYADLIAGMRATEVLSHPTPLSEAALAAPPGGPFGSRAPSIRPEDREPLERFAAALEARLVTLARGTRPDWGPALLLGMARLAAIEASLDSGEWVLLDALGADAEWLEIDPRRRELLPALEAEARREWDLAREQFIAADEFDETAQTALEESASRWLELRRALVGAERIRVADGRRVPRGIGLLEAPPRPRSLETKGPERLEAMRRATGTARREARARLGYHLVRRNCVSELFALVDETFANAVRERGEALDADAVARESEIRLGGYVDPSSAAGAHPLRLVATGPRELASGRDRRAPVLAPRAGSRATSPGRPGVGLPARVEHPHLHALHARRRRLALRLLHRRRRRAAAASRRVQPDGCPRRRRSGTAPVPLRRRPPPRRRACAAPSSACRSSRLGTFARGPSNGSRPS